MMEVLKPYLEKLAFYFELLWSSARQTDVISDLLSKYFDSWVEVGAALFLLLVFLVVAIWVFKSFMRNTLILARREYASFFHSWVGVFVCLFFFLMAGVFFTLVVLSYSKLSMDPAQAEVAASGINQTHFIFGSFYLNINVILIFLVPLLTMRVFAEEKKDQTLELLFTYPLSDFEVVIGKYLGLVWIFELLLVPLLGYAAIYQWMGGSFDWALVFLGFFGFWFLGVFYLSLGIFVSTLSKSSLVSAMVTFSLLLAFWIFEWIAKITDGKLSHVFRELSPIDHYRHFTMGHINPDHLAYFVLFTTFFIFMTWCSVATRNWKSS